MRRAIAVLVLAVLGTTTSAQAGLELQAVTYKLLVGAQQSVEPLEALANDDDVYSVVEAKKDGNKRRVAFKVTFDTVPDDPASVSVRFVGRTSLKSTCDLRLYLYNYRKRRFDFLQDTFTIGDAIDASTISTGSNTNGRYARNGKAKAKYVCDSSGPFNLYTDLARLKI